MNKKTITGADKESHSRNDSFSVREFFQKTKLVTIVAIIAFVVAFVFNFSCDFPFKSFLSNVCYSIIAAYIFYLFQIYIPERKKKKILTTRIRDYIIWRILDNLKTITDTIRNNTRDSLSEEAACSIIEEATEAYNNLFKCTDDFAQVIDENILDVVVELSMDPFLYGLYSCRHYLAEKCLNKDIVFILYEDYGNGFNERNDRLRKLIDSLPQDNTKPLEEVKQKVRQYGRKETDVEV